MCISQTLIFRLFPFAQFPYTNLMQTYIALFRGINVGGKNRLPMKGLVQLLQGLGYQNIRTYIQSGNVIFESGDKPQQFAGEISQTVEEQFGFAPQVLLLTLNEFKDAINNNPFPQGESLPKTLHLGFLAREPEAPRLEDMEKLKSPTESYLLKGKVFYRYAPDGIGRSKLAANSERLLGVPMTDRNWNTVMNLFELAK